MRHLLWIAAITMILLSPAVMAEAVQAQKADTEKTAVPVDKDKVVVTVNGKALTEGQVAEELEKRVEAQKKRMPPSVEFPQSRVQQMRRGVIDMKVDQILIQQEMDKKKLTITDDQVMAEIKKIADQKGQTMEQVQAMIAEYGMTMEDLKEQVRYQMQIKKLAEADSKGLDVTAEDVQKFYDDNPQYFTQLEQVKASHILCGKRGIKPEEKPECLERIKEIEAKLKAGEKFEDLAEQYSDCPSGKQSQGDLGFFGRGQMDPAFEKVAFEQKPGETSGIVETSFGYHIIRTTDKKEAGKTPLAEVQESIKSHLESQKLSEFWQTYEVKMKESAKIEYSKEEQALRDEMDKAAEAQRAARQAQPGASAVIQPKTATEEAKKEEVKKTDSK